jgi:hypothetical protein
MDQILYQYKLNLTTWMYLSSLLTIAIYFKFSRLWSLRNLDLLGLIALAPGLLLVGLGGNAEYVGFVWLFCTGLFFMIRLLIDPVMVRRPLLEPNLTAGGLTFIAISLLVFLMVNVLTKDVTDSDLEGPRRLRALLEGKETTADPSSLANLGPGFAPLHMLASIPMRPLVQVDPSLSEDLNRYKIDLAVARTMAILSHLAVVLGMVVIGIRHFDNIRTGIAAATLYLLMPYTAEMTGRASHVLPAALLVWAIAAYRRPLISGMLLGLATGAIYYPVFLLPLWCSFYWQRGLLRFLGGFVIMLVLVMSTLLFTSHDLHSFMTQALQMFGWTSFSLKGVEGFWASSESIGPYRIPVLVAFIALAASFALWPPQKNLGTLLCCSAAVMLGTQFWHAKGGGIFMGWYLPLLLLTIFRPNLEDRVAVSTLGEGWLSKRKLQLRHQAA